MPGLIASCSKELLRVRNMTPKVWPNWEQLGDASFDLPVAAPPSLGLIPVDLPSTPIVAGNITGPSNTQATKSRETVLDKGKGKADLAPEAEGSRKRKSSMILALSS
jgi:hypothetical protein